MSGNIIPVSADEFTFDFTMAKFRALQRSVDNINETVQKTNRMMTYVEKVIRDHENEDWCEHDIEES